ncbi:DUF3015 family protein [Vibrio coralliilyticus]|uniref:DUF3015 family protein n=1 Tax=Vibrio coralliilyticus TaxID=190893 RepID=UPI0015609ED9|nr:DUF3015 family protein [Vibrio coralliilyticus]NRF26132.1 DUF3015 family protein [Vibrio coralliilyticus]NRF80385.1 DUF3015 family protein [Vibrio coralliilyticus]
MKYRILALLLSIFAYLPHANASLDGIYKGCGLGHWVANGYANGWLAVTTNVTWDLGTTASISYYSTPGSCSGPFYAAAQFIDRTYPELEQETVQGEGEHMLAMLNILECGQKEQEIVRQGIRSDFAKVLANDSYAEMPHHEKADSYYRIVAKHASQQCAAS